MSALRAVDSDTGPVHYLIEIKAIELLSKMYEAVYLPKVVVEELLHPSAPKAVRA